jgi:hypothetical protein
VRTTLLCSCCNDKALPLFIKMGSEHVTAPFDKPDYTLRCVL